MRKYILVTYVLFFVVSTTFAQGYRYEMRKNNYTSLVGSTTIPQKIIWWNYEYKVPVGFSFNLFGSAVDSVDISDIGAIRFRLPGTSNSMVFLFFGFGASLSERNQDTTQTRISYLISGERGRRILKIEYNNAGFKNGGMGGDSVSFQLWLYELDFSMEAHIGPCFSSNPEEQFINGQGPAIGLMSGDDQENTIFALMLSGTAAAPTQLGTSNIYQLPCLSGTPQNGTVYRFVPVK